MPDATRVPSPLRVSLDRDGALLRLVLARPKANIIDAPMVAALSDAFARTHRAVRGVLLEAEGPNFSFGASVDEHLPDRCTQMLSSLHALIGAMLEYPAPILTAVRGQCLGGGLELALAGGPIFASPDARFGQPEMKLGVFAPAASVLLPWRVSQAAAEDLLVSGRSINAIGARSIGLVHGVHDDPVETALAYFDEHLSTKSATSVALALVAARGARVHEAHARLAEVERLYLQQLMVTRDANEGLQAFLAKRSPRWEHVA